MESRFNVLKLNKSYFPISVCEWKRVVVDMFSGAVKPVKIRMEDNKISEFIAYNDIEEWKKLIPHEDDNFILTGHGAFIVPKIVVCTQYDKVPFRRAIFPTKRNIWMRDDYTCGYTGKRLTKSQLSVDHIIPTSRGGKNTWENLITCERQLNSDKSDKLIDECEPPLKLLWKPKKPSNGLVFDIFDNSWESFLQ